ncbi:hypothetical protein C1645_826570 [Glomus cerebriforme]|uniref:Uncharacterized protein n=1 Tax=Glomus cerebriforme TaxID=658196 RepID=A0A397SUN0_9GLOM|nr:hypothetical protein C1645_826570 [Glomus cerebriforme]
MHSPEGLQENSIINNITNKYSFSLQIVGMPKFIEETGEYVCVKKAIFSKDGTIFNFMLRPPNNKSEVIESPLLAVSKPEVKRYNDTNNKITEAELKLKLVKKLFQKASIEEFDLSYLSETSSDIFSLKQIAPSYYSLCD